MACSTAQGGEDAKTNASCAPERESEREREDKHGVKGTIAAQVEATGASAGAAAETNKEEAVSKDLRTVRRSKPTLRRPGDGPPLAEMAVRARMSGCPVHTGEQSGAGWGRPQGAADIRGGKRCKLRRRGED